LLNNIYSFISPYFRFKDNAANMLGNLTPYRSMSVNKGFYISKERAKSAVYETACCSCESVGTTLLFKMASKMAAIHCKSSKIVISF